MSNPFFNAVIIKVTDETELVKRFFIRMPEDSDFHFKAGQFISINLPIDHHLIRRHYSIASAPSADFIFEICIGLNPHGKGSPYMFENFKPGTSVKVSQAHGKFVLPDPIDTDICFICTGTGIAPLRSQVLEIFNQNLPHKNIFLIFGNRFEKDILYRTEMETLEKTHTEFRFIPVLSRENPGWTGRKGYVHQIYEELFRDKRPAKYYICGWTEMLHEARHRLEAMGYDKKVIKFESYD